MTRYAKHVSTRVTSQGLPIPGTAQKQNSAGGFSWTVDCWKRLDRFLILGAEGGSYYASERALTAENAQAVLECAQQDVARTVARIVEMSHEGRAPKNDPAIFALAMLSKHPEALAAMPRVCRTGTHLFQFVEAARQFRGVGRGLRRAIAGWYDGQSVESLSYQLAKYRQRSGWSHRDLLRLSHPKSDDAARNGVYRWAVGKPVELPEQAKTIRAMLAAKDADEATVCRLIRDENLPRECVPTGRLNSARVWGELLLKMPMTAMIRNLGKMSAVGLVKPMSTASHGIASRLTDATLLKKARIHPLSILTAQKIYASGCGMKGSLSWVPDPQIVDALDAAFYAAFANVEPTGKRWLLGVDVSDSMSSGCVAGSPLTPREAAAAMSMVTLRTEPSCFVHGFSGDFVDLGLSKRMRLDAVLEKTSRLSFGPTDCAVPMQWALKNKVEADVFVILTDSETWFGGIHPAQALRKYREKTGIDAKLIVTAMVSNGFTIADPNDAGMLDVVGFDAAVPQVMREFVIG